MYRAYELQPLTELVVLQMKLNFKASRTAGCLRWILSLRSSFLHCFNILIRCVHTHTQEYTLELSGETKPRFIYLFLHILIFTSFFFLFSFFFFFYQQATNRALKEANTKPCLLRSCFVLYFFFPFRTTEEFSTFIISVTN